MQLIERTVNWTLGNAREVVNDVFLVIFIYIYMYN